MHLPLFRKTFEGGEQLVAQCLARPAGRSISALDQLARWGRVGCEVRRDVRAVWYERRNVYNQQSSRWTRRNRRQGQEAADRESITIASAVLTGALLRVLLVGCVVGSMRGGDFFRHGRSCEPRHRGHRAVGCCGLWRRAADEYQDSEKAAHLS